MKIEINDEWLKLQIVKEITQGIRKRDIKEALKQAFIEKMKEWDVEKIKAEAMKKAIKDVAKWKLQYDNIELRMSVESLERQFKQIMADIPGIKEELRKVTKYFQQVIKP